MRTQATAVLLLSLVAAAAVTTIGLAQADRAAETWTRPVQKATCGPKDRTETGLQGQTTLAERMSGAADTAYNCNLELVGQFRGEGARTQMAAFDTCAYYAVPSQPGQQPKGVVVIDASDPARPFAATYLTARSMWDPWESLKVNASRKLLAAVQAEGGDGPEPGFAVYDISVCAKPVLKASVNLAAPVRGHAGNFAPDGMTYYGTDANRSIYPIDIRNPSQPKLLGVWKGGPDHTGLAHDLGVSDDGTRFYSAQIGRGLGEPYSGNPPRVVMPGNGLVILDVTDYQKRQADPQPKIISQLLWRDGSAAQEADPIMIKGRPFILFTDELGSGGMAGVKASCAQDLSPFGFGRLIDISDERRPKLASQLKLEVHDPANCSMIVPDSQGTSIFGYSAHYCTVDNPADARYAACSYREAGVRIFDIQDPSRPKEIAYYKSPAVKGPTDASGQAARASGRATADSAGANPRWLRRGDQTEIWFTTGDNGFQIVRFTNALASIGKTMAGRDPIRDLR